MGRHGDTRTHPAVHVLQFLTARVAGNVNARVVAFGMDFDAQVRQAVLQRADGDFVAGNDARREDAGIAGLQLDGRVAAVGDARHGRTRFALRAGRQVKDLAVLELGRLAFGERLGNALHQADVAGGGEHAVHRAADQADAAAAGLGGAHDRVHPRHVGGEAADHDLALQATDQDFQGDTDIGFGAGAAFDEDIGRVADHSQDAGITQRGQAADIGRRAGDRFVVDLPVARVHDGAEIGGNGQAVGLGDRVGDGDIVDLERADRDMAVQRHFGQAEVIDAGLTQLFADQEGGERRGVHGRLDLVPQPAQGADMVLVGMGQDDTQDGLALEEFGIGHDDLDAGRRQVAEGHTDVDDDPLPVMGGTEPVKVQVHADFVRAAQRQKHKFVLILSLHFYFVSASAGRFPAGRAG